MIRNDPQSVRTCHQGMLLTVEAADHQKLVSMQGPSIRAAAAGPALAN
jgi:hypothetical protein